MSVAPSDRPTPRQLTFALGPGVMLAGVAGGLAFPLLPSAGLRVGMPAVLIGLLLSANRLTRVVVNPIVGVVTDRLGGRRTMLAGLVMLLVVMVLFVLGVETSHPFGFFLAGRIVHGFGSSCVFVSAQALALEGGGAAHGGRVTGAVRSAIQIGVPLGLVSGGVLADLFGEAATFELAGGAVLAALVVASLRVPDLKVEALQRSIVAALRSLVDVRLSAVAALGFASSFAGTGMVLTTTTMMVHARHLSLAGIPERATSSVLMGWLVLSEAMAMPWLGRLGDRRDAHARIALGGLASTVLALIGLAWSEDPSIAVGLFVLGLGVGGLGPSLLALVGRLVPSGQRGLGVGALQVATDLGGTLGPLVGSALLTTSLSAPYLVTAAVNALLLPFAWILVRSTRPGVTADGSDRTSR